MKKVLLLLLIANAFTIPAFSQLNMTLLSNVQYGQDLSDVWGWADPDTGIEYAIVGLRSAVSIVSLEDPENAVEVARIPGPSSTWRDIKTWGYHAYVTNETSNGVLVIDLSKLPDEAPYFEWSPELPALGGKLNTCHNLYIDEFGTCYLAGCDVNSGGVIYVDVASEPGVPTVAGWGPPEYSHDVYARNNLLYSSEIYRGQFAVYDVSDKTDPFLLARQETPFLFTHNTWLSDDGNTIFTTDERGNAPIASYDISDLDNIRKLDEFRPVLTLDKDVIPHNVHVWQDWLIISYYTDGGIVVDASRPDNLVEVGNFDTFFGGNGGFSGAWGAYPFLPSGIVLVSDIGNGLYVLAPNYVRACWLEGTVTEEGTGALLSGVEVKIYSSQPNLGFTDVEGKYSTGQAIPGTFDVSFSKNGYETKTVSADLENGLVTNLNVVLKPIAPISISGLVKASEDNSPISGARVIIYNNEFRFETATNASGNFDIPTAFAGSYAVTAGAWGYRHFSQNMTFDSNPNVVISLDKGYQDDFFFDLGWISSADASASTGFWEKGEPEGTVYQGAPCNPDFDLANDIGDECYVTGNAGGNAADDDVDNGRVTLTSPLMDLTRYDNPLLRFSYWFVNTGGAGTPNDKLEVKISNGTDTVDLRDFSISNPQWQKVEIELNSMINITGSMKVMFETEDLAASGHLVEAAIDGFEIIEADAVNTTYVNTGLDVKIFPNPFSESLTLEINNNDFDFSAGEIKIINYLGRTVESFPILSKNETFHLGKRLNKGFYLLRVTENGELVFTTKIIKQ